MSRRGLTQIVGRSSLSIDSTSSVQAVLEIHRQHTAFLVRDVSDPERTKVMWRLSAAGGSTRVFTYGTVPDGWKEIDRPEPLALGRVYAVGDYQLRFSADPKEVCAETAKMGRFQGAEVKRKCFPSQPR